MGRLEVTKVHAIIVVEEVVDAHRGVEGEVEGGKHFLLLYIIMKLFAK